MTGIRARILCAVTVAMIGMTPVFAQQSTPLSDAEAAAIRALILETIRDNPEVVIDAIRAYQTQAAADEEAGRRAAIADDPDLRVVMREWPILGPESEAAARASLAARAQGKYAAFHAALMAQQRANEATIRRAAEEAGLDLDRLQADMKESEVEAHIARSRELATQLGITGTPTFIIGDALVPGFAEKAQLATVIAEARDNAGEP